jgi:hypothetical protein
MRTRLDIVFREKVLDDQVIREKKLDNPWESSSLVYNINDQRKTLIIEPIICVY